MRKYSELLAIKLTKKQDDRIKELMVLTGMNRPDVIRSLIDNSVMVFRPVPGASLTIDQAPETDK